MLMIQKNNSCFVLGTKNTAYCFRVTQTGHLEHLYYGRKVTLPVEESAEALIEKHTFLPGNTNCYQGVDTNAANNFSLEDIRLEMSAY